MLLNLKKLGHEISERVRAVTVPLIRPRAWWHNKVPLSIFLFVLLIDGTSLRLASLWGLLAVVVAVCCVANFGYALNELFDVEEDRRGGRINAAAQMPAAAMWTIILVSAGGALAGSAMGAGIAGLALTVLELLLPLTYSIPPIRTKERCWVGVLSDALAAHVYPALLALLVVGHFSLASVDKALAVSVLVWSLNTGLRGILSHQLQSAEHDEASGLRTIVHRLGHREVASLVVFLILPIEIIAFSAIVALAKGALFLKIAWLVYVLYECLKYSLDVFPVVVFTRRGQPYLPFVNEGFYKVWGAPAALVDASLFDARFLILVPVYLVFFRPWMRVEWFQIRATVDAAYRRAASLVPKH